MTGDHEAQTRDLADVCAAGGDHESAYMTEDDGRTHWRCLRCGLVTEAAPNAALYDRIADHEAQIRDLLEEREELLTEIRRLRMGNHPAGRALRRDEIAIDRELRALGKVANVVALRKALTERDAEHEGGGGA